jgi:hypothetical protein
VATNAVAEDPAFTVVSEFHDRIEKNSSITFRSWNGKAIRKDSDTEITFFANGVAHMFEWGYALTSYTGTYRIQSDGRISVQFNHFDNDWPDMILERDTTSLLLRPAKGDVGFVMGNRGGATMPGTGGSYWPFRMLTGADETEVLKMIKELGKWPAT